MDKEKHTNEKQNKKKLLLPILFYLLGDSKSLKFSHNNNVSIQRFSYELLTNCGIEGGISPQRELKVMFASAFRTERKSLSANFSSYTNLISVCYK
ncbi:MAG: hypothetical protein F6K18_20655 [Okeania sp. SIO2C2]|uniref:hypothetical protein n=1 Tax=Okeania sp. SIO2C2 TaxID=2607787 RepID=UPI0013BA852A|nr:hypothetical protein [Okeania sp. SIO2C2]NEP89045.1 hypothetical protein [Okeania sp. SIO2C2]